MTDHTIDKGAAWLRQRLADLDAIITEGEKATADLQDAARSQAEAALERLRASREKLQALRDDIRAQTETLEQRGDEVIDRIEAQWAEVERGFQALLAELGDTADRASALLAARAKAQQDAWTTSLHDVRQEANQALDAARDDFDAALRAIEAQFDSLKVRALQVGDAAWDGLTQAVAKARASHARAVAGVKDALANRF